MPITTTDVPPAPTTSRALFTSARGLLPGLTVFLSLAGCGPTFDPASLIKTTRVVGARIEVEGAPDRATPRPEETAQVTWLMTSPGATAPAHRWTFAVCAPGRVALGCDSAPLALFEGTDPIPRIAMVVPGREALGAASSLTVYGQICSGADAIPTFDPQHGVPGCTGGGGVTVSESVPLQLADDADADANHNPTADRAFTFDGQAWLPLPSGADPCVEGPRVPEGSTDHVIGNTTEGSDREPYTVVAGAPPVASQTRESLQISQFATAGKLKSQFSFVEAAAPDPTTTVDVTWEAPRADADPEIPAAGLAVTFTFVTRDNRGGTDWTTRAACVTR